MEMVCPATPPFTPVGLSDTDGHALVSGARSSHVYSGDDCHLIPAGHRASACTFRKCHGHIACESLFSAEHQFPALLLCRLLHPGHLFQPKNETEFHQPASAVGKGLGSSMDGHSSIGRILFSHHPLAFHSYKPDSHSHHDYYRIPVSSHSARAISLFGDLPERTHLPAEQGCDTWCQHTGSKHWRITTQGMADSPCVRTVSDGHHQDERTQIGLAG